MRTFMFAVTAVVAASWAADQAPAADRIHEEPAVTRGKLIGENCG
jgi:hypothetical protein